MESPIQLIYSFNIDMNTENWRISYFLRIARSISRISNNNILCNYKILHCTFCGIKIFVPIYITLVLLNMSADIAFSINHDESVQYRSALMISICILFES